VYGLRVVSQFALRLPTHNGHQARSQGWIAAADRCESGAKKWCKATAVSSGASSGKKWPALSG